MPSSDHSIPFEPQVDSPGNHRCGAASLCMVYRSLGLECTQEDIWEKVSRHGIAGERRARTYLLAADALERGLSALVIQAREPWPLLERCAGLDARVVINHRISSDSSAGHYTVLVSISASEAILHDPQRGPDQKVARDELLKLWEPGWRRSEVSGWICVVIAGNRGADIPVCHPIGDSAGRQECLPHGGATCAACGTAVPDRMKCYRCRKEFALQPAAVLACTDAKCAERLWKYLYCPYCDLRISDAGERTI